MYNSRFDFAGAVKFQMNTDVHTDNDFFVAIFKKPHQQDQYTFSFIGFGSSHLNCFRISHVDRFFLVGLSTVKCNT